MNFEEASRLLNQIAPGDALWKKHSHQVAEVAHLLGRALENNGQPVDPVYVRSCALLHDIGRAITHGPLHGWVGYVLLRKHGAEPYARGCIVHWLKSRPAEEVISDGLLSPRFVREVYQRFGLPELSLSDKVMALADSLVMHDKVVNLETRYSDLQKRYGRSFWLDRHQHYSVQYQNEIEDACSGKIENILSPLFLP